MLIFINAGGINIFLSTSTIEDDALADVTCPDGKTALQCECVGPHCDGAIFIGDTCRVYNNGHGGYRSQVKVFAYVFNEVEGVGRRTNLIRLCWLQKLCECIQSFRRR